MISNATFSEALQQVGRKPNPSQKIAVEAAKDEALFVVAGPGTGKTACLTMRMLKLVFVDQVEPSGILAATFTKKAAEELRSRVLGWGYGVQEWLLKHGKLSKIEACIADEAKTGKVMSSWTKDSSHEPTCEACDSKTYCPDYERT